jgi:phosphoadenylyl-sulfate reductase (thioredoxin)
MTRATREDAALLAAQLREKAPGEILAAAAARFPGRIAFATGFGAEGCVIVDLVARARLGIEVFTLDTGCLFAETYALWARLEERYGIPIRGVKGSFSQPEPGAPPPWERDPDGCCEVRKVLPLRAELARLDAWVTAIRRDQTRDRADAQVVEWDERFGLVKVNPLVAWTSADVWAHLRSFDVPTNPLHAQGYASIGCAPCTTPVRPGEDPRAGRWRGREKKECGLHARPPQTDPSRPAITHGEHAEPRGSAPAVTPERNTR